MVPATEDLAILVEVDEIHQQFLTHAASEAVRVPAFSMTRPRSKNHNVPSVYLTTTLEGRRGRERRGEERRGNNRRRKERKMNEKRGGMER